MDKFIDCPYCEYEMIVRDDGIDKVDCGRCYNTFHIRVEYVNDMVIIETEFL